MSVAPPKALIFAGATLLLAGCNTTDRLVDNRPPAVRALASVPPPPETTGSIGDSHRDKEPEADKPAPAPVVTIKPPVLPGDDITDGPATAPAASAPAASATDAITDGRAAYRASHFKDAEKHFRRATRIDPRSSEAWLGIAASADRQRDFPGADKAYAKARAITGSTAEVLNNQGYSYILRGDLKRARDTLSAAQKLDPANKYVENNLILLDSSERKAAQR